MKNEKGHKFEKEFVTFLFAMKFLKDFIYNIAGAFLIAVGIYSFSEKINVAPGGVSGIAIMVKYLTGLPVGGVSLLINIPLLIIAYKFMGKQFTVKTIYAILIYAVVIDSIVTPFFPQYERDRGATFIDGHGAYSMKPTNILMCVVRVWEYHYIKEIVYQEDPGAFVIATEAEHIIGEGFS